MIIKLYTQMAAVDRSEFSPASEPPANPTSGDGGISPRKNDGVSRLTRRSRFKLPKISERGAILMIVWNVFFVISMIICGFAQQLEIVQLGILLVFSYPIVGWLGDFKFGKYKFLQSASYFLLSSIVLHNLSVFVLQDNAYTRSIF